MKMAESENIVLVSSIIYFDDIHVWSRQFSLNLNACKVMKAFLMVSGKFEEDRHNFTGIQIQAKKS